MTSLLIAVFVFIFGTVVGSFLNVLILRFNTGKTLGGRSQCLVCGKTLNGYELVPLFSFIFLGGRCSKCRSKISIQYPLVELASGFIFLFLFFRIFSSFSPLSLFD